VSRTLPGDDSQFALRIHARVVVCGWQRENLIEMVALNPVLEFAWLVSSVRANLEHGDNDDFDGDGRFGRGLGLQGQSEQQRETIGKKPFWHIPDNMAFRYP
jgi:hypothetical protein